ncbi:sugar-specific transcriptional regulator TrmB [Nitrobacteraceae bacterium AZCC 2161]
MINLCVVSEKVDRSNMDPRLLALGLDEKEQRFYLAALELGTAPVTAIAARADISRTNGYDLVQRLQKRGLVTQIEGEGGVRQVVAEDPSVLVQEWERTRTIIDDLVPELRSLYNGPQYKPRIRLYEGVEGIRRAFRETLDCQSKLLLGVLSMHELLEVPGSEWMAQYIEERIRRGIKLKVVRSSARDSKAIWPSSKKEERELRYAPATFNFGMTMYIYDDKVLHISSRQENYALVIQSEELSAMNRSLFEVLWTVGEIKS